MGQRSPRQSDPYLDLRAPTSKGRGYRKGVEGKAGGGEEMEGRVREEREGGDRRGPPCVSLNFP